jgi:phosphoribosylglycinamide formyltransferase-1
MKNIVIFASGEGTNAQSIIDFFKGSDTHVVLIVCNKPHAFVLERAKKENIPTLIVTKELFYSGNDVLDRLLSEKVDVVVCAGFLWKIPDTLLKAFSGRIVNIHPSLLPKFGGKGMYGKHVHKAVLDAGEKESGITIHYLNEQYDEGEIIIQQRCRIETTDTPESLEARVHALEQEWYPKTIEGLLKNSR